MKILSNKKYDMLIIENESLKEIRENDNWYIDMLWNKVEKLEEENRKLIDLISYIMASEWIKYIEKDWEWFSIKWFESIQAMIEENRKLKEELEKLKVKYWDLDY